MLEDKLWWADKFENFNDAKAFQRKALQYGLDRDLSVRGAEFTSEKDFDTQITWWRVFVRFHEVVLHHEDTR